MCVCAKTTSGMCKSVYFSVRIVNPCNLLCGTHWQCLCVYLPWFNAARLLSESVGTEGWVIHTSVPLCSHARCCYYSTWTCVCVCAAESLTTLRTHKSILTCCHEGRTFQKFPFCYEKAAQMLRVYRDGYVRWHQARCCANCCFLRLV